jgi:hypothetical protein
MEELRGAAPGACKGSREERSAAAVSPVFRAVGQGYRLRVRRWHAV